MDTDVPGGASRAALFQRLEALLVADRAQEALDIVRSVLATEPELFQANMLEGRCLVALGRLDDADVAWHRVTAQRPDDPDAAVLGVRCAWTGEDDVLWRRVEHLRRVEPSTSRSAFFVAVAAARTNRDQLALESVDTLRDLDPTGTLPLHAAAEVDLIISARTRRRPVVAEAAAAEMLGRDPLDQVAHRLRLRAIALRSTRSLHTRRHAATQLAYLREASAAGHRPHNGQLHQLTLEAIGSTSVALVGVFFATIGAWSVDREHLGWPLAVALVTSVWLLAFIMFRRRIVLISKQLPVAGRSRILRPVTGSIAATSAFLGIAGAILLFVLSPFDQQRAIDLGLGRSKAVTRQVVIYEDLRPIPTFPPVTVFPGQRQLPTPQLPTRIPTVRTERVPARANPGLAFSLMRYWSSAAIGSVGIAVLLLLLVRSLRTTPS